MARSTPARPGDVVYVDDPRGVRSAVQRRGSGPPVLLLHGAAADSRMFDALADALADHATVIAYDQRDCGHTTHTGGPYGLVDLADDAVGVLDGLGIDRAHLVGQSLGGAIAQLVAVRHPHRVDRLVLASTFRVGTSLADINPAGMAEVLTLQAGGEAARPQLAALFTTPGFVEEHPDFVDTWAAIQPIVTPDQQDRRRQAVMAPVEPVDLTGIVARTLVIAGDADRIVPADHTRALAVEIPDARDETLSGVGHVSPVQAPAELAGRIVGFLGLDRIETRP